jgi:hypothetical protein
MTMASTVMTALTSHSESAERKVSLLRLHVLRATYLLLVIGLGGMILPELIWHQPTARGVIPSLLGGVWLLAFLGLRYPLQMLPLLMFELAWKAIWLFDYGLPQWHAGHVPPTFPEDFKAIAAGVILMPILIPWGYVYRHYIGARGDRWSREKQTAPMPH